MPLVQVDPAAMLTLFEDTERCMVTVLQVEGKEGRRAGNGFVVHCNDQFTVVAVHPSYQFQGLHNGRMIKGPTAVVKFFDGTRTNDTTFIKLERSVNLIVARIGPGEWQQANYGQLSEVDREDVLSIISLFANITPFVGRVISPRSTSVNVMGHEIAGSRERFTFNLPVAGSMRVEESANYPQRFEMMKNQVLGGPLYNFNGELIGFVDRCGSNFDFKYGVRVQELDAVITNWLAGREWMGAIEAHMKKVQESVKKVQESAESSKRLKRN